MQSGVGCATMFRYLPKRKCPLCAFDFVVVLLDRDSRMQWINGFCGQCDHNLSWKLFRRKRSDQSRNAFIDSLAPANDVGPRKKRAKELADVILIMLFVDAWQFYVLKLHVPERKFFTADA